MSTLSLPSRSSSFLRRGLFLSRKSAKKHVVNDALMAPVEISKIISVHKKRRLRSNSREQEGVLMV